MLEERIFTIGSKVQFEAVALEVFRYQFEHVKIYRDFCKHLGITTADVNKVEAIPFLPIEFFKQTRIISSEKKAEMTFLSSGTTGSRSSQHFIADLDLYRRSFTEAFRLYYGEPNEMLILALLPSYLEQGDSSLVYMVDWLIKESEDSRSGFYLNNIEKLAQILLELDRQDKKVLLIGVSYALLDLVETHSFQLKNTTIMETGGMKGMRKELIRQALHQELKWGFGVNTIHSEYGMTELLSQAYSKGEGLFHCPPWMQILTRDPEDPLTLIEGKTGGINVIDLANLYSCSFIATQDLGKLYSAGDFEILGRFDTSDIRGCNLMVL